MDKKGGELDAPKIRKDGEPDRRGHSDGSRSTQFASGDGRRRPGRRKHSTDEKTDVIFVRDMLVSITISGKRRYVSTRLANLLKMREKALKGEQKAQEYLDRRFAQFEPPCADPDLTCEFLSEDREILAGWTNRAWTGHDPAEGNHGPNDQAEHDQALDEGNGSALPDEEDN